MENIPVKWTEDPVKWTCGQGASPATPLHLLNSISCIPTRPLAILLAFCTRLWTSSVAWNQGRPCLPTDCIPTATDEIHMLLNVLTPTGSTEPSSPALVGSAFSWIMCSINLLSSDCYTSLLHAVLLWLAFLSSNSPPCWSLRTYQLEILDSSEALQSP